MNEKLPLLSPEYASSPQEFWRELRESEPVYYAEDLNFWVITRHADIVEIAKDTTTFSSSGGPGGRMAEDVLSEDEEGIGFLPMIQHDPPEHTRVRSLFAKAFTPKRIADMEGQINDLARDLTEELYKKHEAGQPLDLVNDFASPLPVFVIARMMGIPLTDRSKLRVWSDSMAVGMGEGYSVGQQISAMSSLSRAMEEIVADVRKCPEKDTLIGAMVDAAEEGERLRDDEIVGLSKLLWLAGNETTTNLISNGSVFLLNNPGILEELRNDKELIPLFVEEMLRYEGPVMGLFRNATRDTEFRGKQIREGDSIWLLFSAGNLDPEVFENPDTFDLHRDNHNHLAMGKGVHFCIGSSLAKLEAKVAFEWLVDILPRVRLDFHAGKRIPVPVLSGWVSLPMTLLNGD